MNVLDVSKMKSKLRQGRFDQFIYLFYLFIFIHDQEFFEIGRMSRISQSNFALEANVSWKYVNFQKLKVHDANLQMNYTT